ncbi:hypothetical protein [Gordonibacter urolithinfaciens]|uniref:Uncharacterized protein n=1 Tax=Gordonibacter urolithinfaciens TaxID=1335613 RepID=A0A6N8IGY2_9ACTN|nr:hypothetical protein [Gordonibacter urolithinfaciens]MVM54530.1 hypothetical protein [Gordonibacter urolithinfaciens]MVN14992.1 hypothetical protein [Gordonibacter urolithinfaciens]MVN38501.1 hypothetical protein [Gordonibacter urolithinfaciens]MVN55159.1 hypothetical protein [Gordonibacter urolithinfaciens]MVN60599.1 hypothetical protein [Gordonibacter urolithinfaciens]
MTEKKYIVTADEAYKLHSITEYPGEWTLPGGEADMWLKAHEYRERVCYDSGIDVFRCSACGVFVKYGAVMDCCTTIPMSYCPNCGAKVVG